LILIKLSVNIAFLLKCQVFINQLNTQLDCSRKCSYMFWFTTIIRELIVCALLKLYLLE